ncbi:hypothetical protein DFH08DRAFT_796916 [Mycena albidolilacea]|uniref:Uncharacterized protein n=1 Tax=Mycena albidolilacea TaxID=1033008 RepID=A0AAD7AW38_9AGAR|nr:hypothetical protein DFH08DRAFT_796916 [Mycena albidolilacea]
MTSDETTGSGKNGGTVYTDVWEPLSTRGSRPASEGTGEGTTEGLCVGVGEGAGEGALVWQSAGESAGDGGEAPQMSVGVGEGVVCGCGRERGHGRGRRRGRSSVAVGADARGASEDADDGGASEGGAGDWWSQFENVRHGRSDRRDVDESGTDHRRAARVRARATSSPARGMTPRALTRAGIQRQLGAERKSTGPRDLHVQDLRSRGAASAQRAPCPFTARDPGIAKPCVDSARRGSLLGAFPESRLRSGVCGGGRPARQPDCHLTAEGDRSAGSDDVHCAWLIVVIRTRRGYVGERGRGFRYSGCGGVDLRKIRTLMAYLKWDGRGVRALEVGGRGGRVGGQNADGVWGESGMVGDSVLLNLMNSKAACADSTTQDE